MRTRVIRHVINTYTICDVYYNNIMASRARRGYGSETHASIVSGAAAAVCIVFGYAHLNTHNYRVKCAEHVPGCHFCFLFFVFF